MTHTEWNSRERRRAWMGRLQIGAGSLILVAIFMMYVVILFQFESLLVRLP